MKLNYLFHEVANPVGIVGVIIILIAYLLLQLDRMSQDSVFYSLLNTIGSVLILYSLYFYWNLPSGIIEIAWLLISIFGLFKAFHLRRKSQRRSAI